ncbi:MAG: hypothetical protein ACE5G7_07245, partial [Candidatus Hydrothermarchaeaceae archaeon]
NMTLDGRIHYPAYPTAVSDITGEPLVLRDISLKMAESRTLPLDLHIISRGEARTALQLAEETIRSMSELGFTTNRVSRMLGGARLAFGIKDYEGAKALADEIVDVKGTAVSVRALLVDVERDIESAEEGKGLRVVEAKDLYNLALAAFDREDYSTAQQRLGDARLVLTLETEGKVNLLKLVLDYWYAVILGSLVSIGGLLITYQRVDAARINRRIEDLWIKESNISNLIREAQTKYYVDGTMSAATYKSTVEGHEDRLVEIEKSRAGLITKRAGRIGIHEETKALREEGKNLAKFMKLAQERYYKRRAMSHREYERGMKRYKARKAEVEERIVLLEAETEKRRRKG